MESEQDSNGLRRLDDITSGLTKSRVRIGLGYTALEIPVVLIHAATAIIAIKVIVTIIAISNNSNNRIHSTFYTALPLKS